MGSITILGQPVEIFTRDPDIKKEYNPRLTSLTEGPGFYIDSHLFKAAAMQLIDYTQGAFGRCVGYRIIIMYLDPRFSGIDPRDTQVIDLNISHEQLYQMEKGAFNLDIHICKALGFSAALMCSIIQSIYEKVNRSSD